MVDLQKNEILAKLEIAESLRLDKRYPEAIEKFSEVIDGEQDPGQKISIPVEIKEWAMIHRAVAKFEKERDEYWEYRNYSLKEPLGELKDILKKYRSHHPPPERLAWAFAYSGEMHRHTAISPNTYEQREIDQALKDAMSEFDLAIQAKSGEDDGSRAIYPWANAHWAAAVIQRAIFKFFFWSTVEPINLKDTAVPEDLQTAITELENMPFLYPWSRFFLAAGIVTKAFINLVSKLEMPTDECLDDKGNVSSLTEWKEIIEFISQELFDQMTLAIISLVEGSTQNPILLEKTMEPFINHDEISLFFADIYSILLKRTFNILLNLESDNNDNNINTSEYKQKIIELNSDFSKHLEILVHRAEKALPTEDPYFDKLGETILLYYRLIAKLYGTDGNDYQESLKKFSVAYQEIAKKLYNKMKLVHNILSCLDREGKQQFQNTFFDERQKKKMQLTSNQIIHLGEEIVEYFESQPEPPPDDIKAIEDCLNELKEMHNIIFPSKIFLHKIWWVLPRPQP